MSNAKAIIALIVSVLISGTTAAGAVVTDKAWLMIFTITLAAVNPLLVWSTSNSKQSEPASSKKDSLP